MTQRHTATLIDNKLYILGGMDLNFILLKTFFYLNVSVPFNTQELSWQDLSNVNIVPPHHSATSVNGGTNNHTLFLFGGNTTDQTMALVYTFDSENILWNLVKIDMTRKNRLTSIIDYNRKLYLLDGSTHSTVEKITLNDMLILDTINLNWKEGSLINAPSLRVDYGGSSNTITYNPETLIISKGFAFTLSEVYIYDTINDNWDTKGRFSTVLGLDGQRIIIYGGAFVDPGYSDTTLYVLDLTNYNWYIPNISGNPPKPRIFHKANVIGKYMVVSFGNGYNQSLESDILLLDISKNDEYIWTTMFVPSVPQTSPPPSSPPPSSSPSPSPSPSNSSKLVGAIVGSLLGGVFLLAGILFIYKYKQKQKTNYENNNTDQEKSEFPIEGDIHD
ncbi:hypothetical protein GLOIN_2v1834755 [Rhizophagus clarus]|uniref:Galactose oxidase n=1 Tax=Rhizophagus clarus TaxID=94130 RepID=A0A8H3L2Q5_9GLOM|nr:hypothetical protein GLOIN_2v1834755 [Rhizophagus clarus]